MINDISVVQKKIRDIINDYINLILNGKYIKNLDLDLVIRELERINIDLRRREIGLLINIELHSVDINIGKSKRILKYCDYVNEMFEEINNLKYELIFYEALNLSDDLIFKVNGYNNREITLPLKIENLIDYSLSSSIKKDEIDITLLLVIIKIKILVNLYKERKLW